MASLSTGLCQGNFKKGTREMNEILDWLLLVSVLSIAAVWIVAVFCFIIFTLGGYDE